MTIKKRIKENISRQIDRIVNLFSQLHKKYKIINLDPKTCASDFYLKILPVDFFIIG